jgi:hypothetical protein
MDEELDIIVIAFDDPRQAEAGLMSVFGLDGARARRFVRELPVVAKRSVNRVSADRYADALRSIGGHVELRPSAWPDGEPAPAAVSSLPIPAPSMMARLGESLQVERETQRAIERFRAAEGLDLGDVLPIDRDPHNPDIPRPPAVPRDLAKMPNAKLPKKGGRPGWMLTDPLAQEADGAHESKGSPRPHNDARLPPPPSRGPASRAAAATARPGGGGNAHELRGGAMSGRPSAVGLAHAATASVRPGIGMFSWWERATARATQRRLLRLWLTAVVLAVAAGAYVWSTGALDSASARRERALRAQGIEAGELSPAATWLESPDHSIDGIEGPAARELVERLTRAGALSVHAAQIEASGSGQRARGLLIELPEHPAERRTILWHAARTHGPEARVPDEAGRYHLLTFQ